MKRATTEAGREAEGRALAYLQSKGLVLIDRNVRHRHGEIDLVMRDGSTLVKVLAWYDNEWGYSCRMLDTARAWINAK